MEYASGRMLAAVQDGVGLLTFNQPEKRNAMSVEMWDGLAAILEGWGEDDAVRVVVMTGAGDKAFVSGADISQFGERRGSAEAQREYDAQVSAGRAQLAGFAKPLIARIQGFCLGGGLGIAMQADIRVAAEGSSFGIPAARLGIVYGFDMTRRLVSLVGHAQARLMLLGGERMDAMEALRIGLVDRVVPAAGLHAAVDALAASGIRAAFLHGSPKPEPLPGQPHFSEVPHPRAEVERLRRGTIFASDGLLTLGMAILGPHYSATDVALADFRLAAELALVASMHQGGGPPKSPGGWDAVEAAGLAGPGTNIVHGNDLPDDRLRRFVDAGVTFTATPEAEMAMGHGHPITGRLRALGTAPSLGVDIESAVSGEMLTVARIALAHQRALDHASIRARTGAILERPSITAREALSWITNRGAEALGLADRVGSLAPGKQADLVVIDARSLSLAPVHDPVATVLQAGRADIEAVLVAGGWRKRDFRLLHPGLDAIRLALIGSGERIVAALAR